jgi:hypothetical protein
MLSWSQHGYSLVVRQMKGRIAAMSWSYDTSLDRATKRHEALAGLTIADVIREIDFDEISQLHPRRVTGTHLYAGVANFTALLREADADGAENLLLQLHLFAREASRSSRAARCTFRVRAPTLWPTAPWVTRPRWPRRRSSRR